MIGNLSYNNLFDYLINNHLSNKEDLEGSKLELKDNNNFNWIIELPNKVGKLFVKQMPHYRQINIDNRITKEWHIYNYLSINKALDHTSYLIPEILHFDNQNSILIYKLANDYVTLESYYKNLNTFSDTIAILLGTTLAKLHFETMNSQECHNFITKFSQDKLQYQLPYPDYLSDYIIKYLEPESLHRTPVQAWKFLGIIQQDENVKKIIKELVLHHEHLCLTHNNIQFKNIFIHRSLDQDGLFAGYEESKNSLIKFINWEACSWGDPACDLGKAITGYFIFWLNSMITHHTIEIKKSIQLATIPLEVVQPSIGAMIKAYISIYPEILNHYTAFTKRVVQFAGLGLINQLLEEFQLQPETARNHQKIYFYIARQLLCQPEKFLSI
ncbi:hypothetical protein NIES37_29310 [Tolypothrix tenuis PCC 7101]|uniref:Aminoglycoside phosphotransferase domain-containing protein n=1 Tax=Tolypothrix tenuis PCC 7101 TaxID=231146 RepID=A0A1Z4MZT4_9CYAN|nr:hypothetical protein [Aulosira sp. FACHB-113]BAY98953.1 hypothetical protein NIES37_29310 [Tolypothrix tenuis PCC 7101]BAZ77128.1 hypothetical protein NIES50_57310 [Aulosira laxa NIES-50]